MVFRGTAVTRGSAEGLVTATGRSTEVGRVSRMVEEAEESATPLERRLDRLGRRLVYLVVGIGVFVAGSGLVAGKPLFVMIETALALAIAAVPEGLPIVATVALGRGMWRMARRNALVKRLSAVETLGATTVILTDKTGTLTENRMSLRRLALRGGDVEMDQNAEDRRDLDEERHRALCDALRAGVLCSNAELGDGEGEERGEPMETALLRAGRAFGLERPDLLESLPEEREESFDSDVQMMATFHRQDDGLLVAVKGAPEAVLQVATREGRDGEEVELDEERREAWRRRNEDMAGDGLRVLALAQRRAADPGEEPYEGLTWLGLAGFHDPPRASVKDAIARCREAGVRVVMVTGDQPATAAQIAREVGLTDEEEPSVVRGRDVAEEGFEALEIAEAAPVFARVTPAQKLDLVTGFQEAGAVVGMTGDGVNDAPALKKADIGIAMGRRGTEVARQTGDIVLKDDSFETIVAAIGQGRTIFRNIRTFVVFLLSGNLGQILAVSAAAVVAAPLPLRPLQILFLNLLFDVFPALALGVGAEDPRVLRRPPRDPHEPILTRRHWLAISGFGAALGLSVLATFATALKVYELDVGEAVTVAFLAYGLARLWHVFNMRPPESGILANEVVRNPWVWAALGLCALLLASAVVVPAFARLLGVRPLDATGWALVAAGSLLPLFLGQLGLVAVGLGRRHHRDGGDQ
jgi:Ca2+-transporting ATPase